MHDTKHQWNESTTDLYGGRFLTWIMEEIYAHMHQFIVAMVNLIWRQFPYLHYGTTHMLVQVAHFSLLHWFCITTTPQCLWGFC
jgi:hypothetical protein